MQTALPAAWQLYTQTINNYSYRETRFMRPLKAPNSTTEILLLAKDLCDKKVSSIVEHNRNVNFYLFQALTFGFHEISVVLCVKLPKYSNDSYKHYFTHNSSSFGRPENTPWDTDDKCVASRDLHPFTYFSKFESMWWILMYLSLSP